MFHPSSWWDKAEVGDLRRERRDRRGSSKVVASRAEGHTGLGEAKALQRLETEILNGVRLAGTFKQPIIVKNDRI